MPRLSGNSSSKALTKSRGWTKIRRIVEKGEMGSLASLRSRNRERVIEALRELGVASRAEIARHTGLSRSTVSSLVADRQDDGLTVDRADTPGAASTGGRPPALIA